MKKNKKAFTIMLPIDAIGRIKEPLITTEKQEPVNIESVPGETNSYKKPKKKKGKKKRKK